MDLGVGELAALGTALCWAFTAMFFADAGARIGSLVVNFLRLVMALAILTLMGWLTRGLPWPTDASAHAWLWLTISGLIGFSFGDLCLFRALVLIGPRLGSLLMSFAPPFTALIGWLVLGETLRGDQLLGMALTVGGVAWALGDRRAPRVTTPEDRGSLVAGVLLGLGGALGQAAGLVLSKHGMGDYDPMAATQIRVLAGTLGFALIFTLGGWWSRVGVALRQPRPMAATAAGAVFGPFLGVTLSLVAVQHATAGVAASIMSTSPILVIPIVVLWKRERVGLGSVLGTIVAVIGVIVLVR
ncbi:MAG: DMT family transporter [Myxococcales bacterium]|nr:DMT family transporter [Myxococcales bacterium]MCB9717299.1 DMT family transporter [Myxococcales bacterium]